MIRHAHLITDILRVRLLPTVRASYCLCEGSEKSRCCTHKSEGNGGVLRWGSVMSGEDLGAYLIIDSFYLQTGRMHKSV